MSHLQVIFMDTVQRCKETRLIQGTQTVQLSVLHDCSVMSNSLWPHGLKPARLLCPWIFPGKNTGVGYHFLLQGIFQTQGSKPYLLHHRWILYYWAIRKAPIYVTYWWGFVLILWAENCKKDIIVIYINISRLYFMLPWIINIWNQDPF